MGGADYKKRLKDLIKIAEDAGWRVSKTGSGHWNFIPADKDQTAVNAPSTSSDHRGVVNLEARLKRSGLGL